MADDRSRPAAPRSTSVDQRAPLAHLLQPDGSVIVPAEIAGEVLRLLVFALHERARSTGALPTLTARQLVTALDRAAHRERGPYSPVQAPNPAAACDHPAEALSVRETADRMRCSPQHVRALLAAGRLSGRKTRGGWIVHTRLADSQAPQRNTS